MIHTNRINEKQSGTEQVKGYGTLLMNYLKYHVQKDKLEYFLTYAIGYLTLTHQPYCCC
jgi:hypothetical protein